MLLSRLGVKTEKQILKPGLQSCQISVVSVLFRSILFYKQNHLAHAAHRLEAVGTKKMAVAIGYIRVRGRRILVKSRHSVDTLPLNEVQVLDCAIPAMSSEH